MIVAELNYIAPPEPDLTPAVIIEQARQLVSYLREKSAEIENARCIPPQVDQKLREAGFYRMLQPKRVGGYEFDLDTFIDTMLELYRADGATGWVACFIARAHSLGLRAKRGSSTRDLCRWRRREDDRASDALGQGARGPWRLSHQRTVGLLLRHERRQLVRCGRRGGA